MAWAEKRGVRLEYIQPGNPQQNAYIERYNRTVRGDWLGQNIFETLEEAQEQATEWLWTYNNPSRALLRNTLPGSGPTQHGHRRDHTCNETENGRVVLQADPIKNGGITGQPIRFFMTAGQVSDYTGARALVNSLPAADWLLGPSRDHAAHNPAGQWIVVMMRIGSAKPLWI